MFILVGFLLVSFWLNRIIRKSCWLSVILPISKFFFSSMAQLVNLEKSWISEYSNASTQHDFITTYLMLLVSPHSHASSYELSLVIFWYQEDNKNIFYRYQSYQCNEIRLLTASLSIRGLASRWHGTLERNGRRDRWRWR